MSKSTIALFSAVLFGALPLASTAWAEDELAAAVQAVQEPNTNVPPPQIEMPDPEAQDRDAVQGAPSQDLDTVEQMPAQDQAIPDAAQEEAAQTQQPSAINPDGEAAPATEGKGKYDKTSFFADFKHFQIGDIAPESYREPHYKIDEWKKRHLTAPEEGSHWTYMGGDYVLITDDEGKILKVLSGDIIYQ